MKTKDKAVIIVAGSRRFNNYNFVAGALEALIGDQDVIIMTGGATGVDTLAYQWAGKKKLDRHVVHAEWKKHGKAAGPMRNEKMAKLATHLIAFDDNTKGTNHMIQCAGKYGLTTKIVKIGN